jgi:O-antigen ligase
VAHEFSPAQPPSPASVQRVGEMALWVGLAASLSLTIALAWTSPDRVWLVPVGLAGLIATWALLRDPVLGTYAAVGLTVMALNKEAGLQPNQVAYGLFVYAFLGLWYLRRIVERERFIHNILDRLVALLLFAGMPFAIVLGLAFGADPVLVRGETISFSMLAFYFPVKEVCRRTRRGPQILAGLVILIGAFVAIRNLLSFRDTVAAATVAWQIADARVGGGGVLNEIQLLFGTITALVLLLYVRTWKMRLLLVAGVVLCLVGLVLTRSRGYYVDLVLGVIVLMLLLRGRQRLQLGTLVFGGGALLLLTMMLFFGPVAELLVDGTLLRLSTIGSATTDLSLVNRFLETEAVVDKGRLSPILGWGLGADFTYFDLVTRKTFTWEFIHNGYAALWFKLGLWGLILVLAIWGVAAWHGLTAYRAVRIPAVHRAIALAAAVGLIALVPSTSTSSPFFTREMLQAMVVQIAIAAGLYQRYMLSSGASAVAPD